MKEFIEFFNKAIENKDKYVAVVVTNNCKEPEIIINPNSNFEEKLNYYKNAYSEDLTLKTFNKIKIIKYSSGNSIEELI